MFDNDFDTRNIGLKVISDYGISLNLYIGEIMPHLISVRHVSHILITRSPSTMTMRLLENNKKQNRESTEGYSRWKVEKRLGKFEKSGLNNWTHKQVPKRGTEPGVRKGKRPCWHATPFANALWKPLIIRWRSSSVSRSWKWWKVCSVGSESEWDWLFNVTWNDISVIYVTAHRCAGGIEEEVGPAVGLRTP